jgi:hypothetical protein
MEADPNQPLVDWAQAALQNYDQASGGGLTEEGLFPMLLASLMHLAAARGWSFSDAVKQAEGIFQEEVAHAAEVAAEAAIDTSDIPEAGEEFFAKARLIKPQD